ncbi:MAG: Hsp20/alpha crystallin family protein, partial [Blastocatellia bacterium]
MTNKSVAALAPREAGGGLFAADPFFRNFEQRMKRFFGEGFRGLGEAFPEESWSVTTWAPACDIFETDHEIVVKAELPGVKKEDLHVSLENNMLTI